MISILVLFILLLFLSYQVYKGSSSLNNIDINVLEYFHSIQSKLNDLFFSTVTWLGSLWIIAPLFTVAVIILVKNGLQHYIFPIFVGFIGTILSTYALKYLFERERPHIFETIGELPFDPSFPSAHTAQSLIFVCLIILILFHSQIEGRYLLSASLLLIALFVALSRIYLQVHYLSDIVAGVLIVLVWTLITHHLISR